MICVICVVAGLAMAASGHMLPQKDIECIEDKSFTSTEAINQYFLAWPWARNTFLIICGAMMDILIVSMFIYFLLFQESWRWLVAMALFYFTRMGIQNIFLMKFPEGYAWDYPGFPSLTVPYPKTNDFFYSGHVGGALLAALEYRTLGFWWMSYFGYLTSFMQILLMIALRSHYSIDMISGLVFAHYFYIIATKY